MTLKYLPLIYTPYSSPSNTELMNPVQKYLKTELQEQLFIVVIYAYSASHYAKGPFTESFALNSLISIDHIHCNLMSFPIIDQWNDVACHSFAIYAYFYCSFADMGFVAHLKCVGGLHIAV